MHIHVHLSLKHTLYVQCLCTCTCTCTCNSLFVFSRLEDLIPIDIVFLHGCDKPTLAYITEVQWTSTCTHVYTVRDPSRSEVVYAMYMYMYIYINVHLCIYIVQYVCIHVHVPGCIGSCDCTKLR